MSSLEYDRLIADVRPHVPGALDSAIEAELFAVLRDFLQRTNIWRVIYQLEISPAELCCVIDPGRGVRLKRLINLFDANDTVGRNWVWPAVMDEPPTIKLLQPVTSAATWLAEVSLYNAEACSPDDVRTTVPYWILADYFTTLRDGVVGNMLSQPAKPYTNAQLALFRLRSFNSGTARARAAVERRNVYNAQSWVFPSAGITRGRQRGV